MTRKILVALVATVLTALAVVPANAKSPKRKATTCESAYTARVKVIKKHGVRAPGRNICRFGVKLSTGKSVDASYGQKVRYLHALQRLVAPAPAYLTASAGPPSQAPAGTLSVNLAPSGLASCIVQHESGGNPLATNGQYHGIAQWSPEAWARMGGHRFASDPHGASYQQQLQVLSDGLRRFGCRDWCPYDGC